MAKSHALAREFREVLRLFVLFGHLAIVQHVKLLERARLLVGLREGKRRVYHVRRQGLAPLGRWLSIYGTQSDDAAASAQP
jgi:hypothetical protein